MERDQRVDRRNNVNRILKYRTRDRKEKEFTVAIAKTAENAA
jgi:hypothetical protein